MFVKALSFGLGAVVYIFNYISVFEISVDCKQYIYILHIFAVIMNIHNDSIILVLLLKHNFISFCTRVRHFGERKNTGDNLSSFFYQSVSMQILNSIIIE